MTLTQYSCWCVALYLAAQRNEGTPPISMLDFALSEGLFFPEYKIHKSMIAEIDRLNTANGLSIDNEVQSFDLYATYSKWFRLIENIKQYGLQYNYYCFTSIDDMRRNVPCVALVNTYHLPYYKNDFCCNHGGKFKHPHFVYVDKYDFKSKEMMIMDPVLGVDRKWIGEEYLWKATCDHKNITNGFSYGFYKLRVSSKNKKVDVRKKMLKPFIEKFTYFENNPSESGLILILEKSKTDMSQDLFNRFIKSNWLKAQFLFLEVGAKSIHNIMVSHPNVGFDIRENSMIRRSVLNIVLPASQNRQLVAR